MNNLHSLAYSRVLILLKLLEIINNNLIILFLFLLHVQRDVDSKGLQFHQKCLYFFDRDVGSLLRVDEGPESFLH